MELPAALFAVNLKYFLDESKFIIIFGKIQDL